MNNKNIFATIMIYVGPRRYKFILTCVLLFFLIQFETVTGYIFEINKVTLTVYQDGLVHVQYNITCNETYPEVNITMLTTKMENILISDEDGMPLGYEIIGNNITIYTLGATSINIEYDTFSFTSMEEGIWTLRLNVTDNLEVKLPKAAIIVYINEIPLSITSDEESTILQLCKGRWEISYYFTVIEPTQGEKHQNFIELAYYLGGGGIVLISLLLYLKMRKNKKRHIKVDRLIEKHPELNEEEINVIRVIANNNGRIFEAELRKRFTGIPRTTLWRLIKRLEKKGIVHVEKIGNQNVIEIK